MTETNLKVFSAFDEELAILTKNEEDTVVDTRNNMLFSVWLLRKIQWVIKQLKVVKDVTKKPHLDMNKAIEAKYKEVLAPFEEIKNKLTAKQVAYELKLQAKVEEEKKLIAEAAEKAWPSEEVKEIVEIETDKLDTEYIQSRAKGAYVDYEIESANMFYVDEKYIRTKPLSIELDLAAVKKDLKAWIKIDYVQYKEVTKIK